MANRRAFLAGLLTAAMMPRRSWAEAGAPSYLSAGRGRSGDYVLCGLGADGALIFEVPLPARGHAAAAHPYLAEAVAFARRPGTFAVALDCATGQVRARLEAPAGRHFYGHGAFSADGARLYTTENDYEAARGVIGIWDVEAGYARIGEFSSGGVGPHEVRLMPDGGGLVVANGGIETHPEAGRAKLNLATMAPSLCYLSLEGAELDSLALDPGLHKNSIRHLAVAPDGTVAFAMQWQGDLTEDVPLLGLHRRGGGLRLANAVSGRRMQGYLGSVAIASDGSAVAVTSPRSGRLIVLDCDGLTEVQDTALADVCGVAPRGGGFLVTTGDGLVQPLAGRARRHDIAWDNHLIAV